MGGGSGVTVFLALWVGAIAQVILHGPLDQTVPINQQAEFQCETDGGITSWVFNGIPRQDLPQEVEDDLEVVSTNTDKGTSVETLTFPARPEYNCHTVQCVVLKSGVDYVESEPATLTIIEGLSSSSVVDSQATNAASSRTISMPATLSPTPSKSILTPSKIILQTSSVMSKTSSGNGDVHKEDSNVIAGSILAAGVLAAGVLAAVAIGTGAIVIIKVFRSCKRRQKPEQETGVGSEDRSFTLLVKAEVGFVNDSSLMESDEMGPRTGKSSSSASESKAPMPTSPHNQANQDAGQGGGSSSSDVENNPEENWTGKSASCNVGGSDKCVVVTGVHQQKPHNDSNDGGLRGGKESILGGCPGQEKAATMNCLTGQAPSNDSQGSINPEGGEKCECQTDGGNDGFVWTNPTYLYNFQEEMCFIHSSPLNADITMVSGRQGSVGTSVPGTLGLRPEPLLEETKNASSLFLGQIQRPQKVPHSKPLVQATHLVSKCRRRKKGGTTPEICQDPWLGNYRVELMKSLHINVDLGFGNCNESFYGSSCQ